MTLSRVVKTRPLAYAMGMDERDDRLQESVRALRAGDRREARRLLGRVVAENPGNVAGWWLLAATLDDPEQKGYALRRVLRLRPDHAEARRLLDQLEAESVPADAADEPAPDAATETRAPPRDILIAGMAVAIALVAILVTVVLMATGALAGLPDLDADDATPTAPALVLGVPACVGVPEGDTVLVFVNNSGVAIDVSRGGAGRERPLFTVAAGEQASVAAVPAREVRYVVEPAEGGAAAEAIYEVPSGHMCRVPIQ